MLKISFIREKSGTPNTVVFAILIGKKKKQLSQAKQLKNNNTRVFISFNLHRLSNANPLNNRHTVQTQNMVIAAF